MSLQWQTTNPNPINPAHTHKMDAGQVGWRLHLVDVGQTIVPSIQSPIMNRNHSEIDKSKAVCGLVPKHGWGLDFFIDTLCSRCVARAKKLNIELPT